MLRVTRTLHPRYNHFTLAAYFCRVLALRRRTRQPITPAVIIPYEEENLVFCRHTPSPEPVPIPPRHAEHMESEEALQSSSPTSYFTAAEYQSQRASSIASTSVAGTEGALSEAETVKVAQVGRDDIEIEDYPVNIIPGWAHLQQEIINSIVESIHANPVFFDHLVARFPDQNEIFGTPIEAWRGLHRVCRRVEARQLKRLEAKLRADEAAAEEEDPGGWEAYIRTGGNPSPDPNNRLLHTPPPSTNSLPDSVRTNITFRNDKSGRLITTTYIVSAEDIQDEHYVVHD